MQIPKYALAYPLGKLRHLILMPIINCNTDVMVMMIVIITVEMLMNIYIRIMKKSPYFFDDYKCNLSL